MKNEVLQLIRKTKLKKKLNNLNRIIKVISLSMNRTKQNPKGREGGREMIASAIKVNVPTAVPRENVTKLELYPSVTHMYSRGIPVYRETTIS